MLSCQYHQKPPMEVFLPYVLPLVVLLLTSFSIISLFFKKKLANPKLPPGKTGWPIVGETLEYIALGKRGEHDKFISKRTQKYSSDVFRTSLFGENMVVFCGAAGNKFLFSNENRIVTSWWPNSVKKVLLSPSNPKETSSGSEAKKMRGFLPEFLKAEALQKYVPTMDRMAQSHFEKYWDNNTEVKVFGLSKKYTFALACKLFLSVEDPDHVSKLAYPFSLLNSGLISVPIDFPGTAFNHAKKSGQTIREELIAVIRKRKMQLLEKRESTERDLLTCMLLSVDGDGRFMNEMEIAEKIVGLLLASHDTTSTSISFVVNFLAEYGHIYDEVHKEQMEIAISKRPGELLNWDDIQKMKYSWSVVCESMRLAPPSQGAFREAITDFTYAGFFVPKGWKTHWTVHSTHKDPKYFPDPERFDPSRFEGKGPAPFTFVPFGGGPRMCPGKEFARLEILVFVHNMVKRFNLRKAIPDEQITYRPSPTPVHGLPILLHPHEN